MAAFGYPWPNWPAALLSWLDPTPAGSRPEFDALCPTGSAPGPCRSLLSTCPLISWRLPFPCSLALTLMATWYGAFHLAAQPGPSRSRLLLVARRNRVDYARAMADAALLA